LDTTVRELLCLYHVYGDPTECKLALVRGGVRSYEDFQKYALPFALDVLARKPEERRLRAFFQYIAEVQFQYFCHLKNFQLTPHPAAGQFIDHHEVDVTIDGFRHNHRILSSMDGSDANAADTEYGFLMANVMRPFEIPPDIEKSIQLGLTHALTAHQKHVNFRRKCILKGAIKVHHSLEQCMFDFMAYLTHFSRGNVFSIHRDDDAGVKDVKAATSHLKRVTLDMRKAIITTIFQNVLRSNFDPLPDQLLKRVFRAREHELDLHSEDDAKLAVYEHVLDDVLRAVNMN